MRGRVGVWRVQAPKHQSASIRGRVSRYTYLYNSSKVYPCFNPWNYVLCASYVHVHIAKVTAGVNEALICPRC